MASQEQRGENEPDLKLQNTIVATTVSKVVQARTVTGGIHHHPPPPARPAPRQLRPAPHGFVGRVDHLADLDALPDGHHTQAIDHDHHALTLYRDHGNTYEVASTFDRLGHSHAGLGQHEQVRTVWREALRLYQEQGRHDEAAQVRRQLDGLDQA